MHAIVRANALKSMVGSLVPNVGMTWLALRSAPLVTLAGPTPNLLSVLLPGVFMSAFATTLLTFSAITAARKRGQVSPALPAAAPWLGQAVLVGLGSSMLFVGPTAAILVALGGTLAAAQASRPALVLVVALAGMVVALLASLVAARRAMGTRVAKARA